MIYYLLTFFLLGVLLAIGIFGIVVSAFTPGINKLNKKFFVLIFINLTLLIIILSVDLIFWTFNAMRTANRIAVFFEYLFVALPMPIFTVYLLNICGEGLKNKLFYSTAFLFVIYLILLGVAQCTEIFYYITPRDFYRGEYHFILTLPIVLLMLLNIFAVIRRKKILSKKYFRAFLFYLLPMTLVTVIHVIKFSEVLWTFGLIFSTVAMFAIILSDHVEQFFMQQKEIVNQQANILILQMRPHFIYNTMTSIYYLCKHNPAQAQKVTLDFTNYLRKNFLAIAYGETILFAKELEHARAYLSIEQVQFEENLFVTYDTPHINFKIPPLTLQPIVENSVKHGLDPDLDPLHILILTRETEKGSEIVVEDDGVGFKFDGKKENFALSNIKKRIELFCGGTLEIFPREGGGTVVKIFVPYSSRMVS